MKYFLLLFFLTLVLMQRGGGRGGGGGKGGRSSGGIGLFPAVTETSFMRGCSSDCRLKFGFNPSQLAMCLDSCHSQDRWRTFKIIGSIIGCLCCFTCCLQVYFQKQKSKTIDIIKEKFMNVSTTYMTLAQFEMEKQAFLRQTWNLVYHQQQVQHQNITLSCQLTNIQPFVQNLQLQGQDQFGSWTSQGVFFCSPTGIKIWMVKDYQDKKRGEQNEDFDLLVYEGQKTYDNRFQGRWYYVDHENQNEYIGTWTLVGKNTAKPYNSYPSLKI